MVTTKSAAASKTAAVKKSGKVASKVTTAAAAELPKAVKIPKAAKPAEKAAVPANRKQKLVRDGFTIPKDEYAVLDELKRRATALLRPAKKGEILRAGIAALKAMDDDAFAAALSVIPTLKTGRPKDEPAPLA